MSTEEKIIRKVNNEAIREIMKNYKLYKIRLMNKNSLSKGVKMRYEKYLKKVEYCISKLTTSVQDVFVNTYLVESDYRLFGFYSSSQYYRLRNKGRDEFLLRFARKVRL